jgi:SAM-dependent methyltransferase
VPTGSSSSAEQFYDDEHSRAAYLRHRHGGASSPNLVMEEPNLLEVLGDLSGASVFDLGCGDGSTAPLLLGLGAARYAGIDVSSAMVDLARARHGSLGVTFRRGAIEDLDAELGVFDLVVSRMALHYVADVEGVVSSVKRLLGPGGRFVFSVSHPVITSHAPEQDGRRANWTVDDYFVRGPRERTWFGSTVVWHHRTIEDYLGALIDAGFRLDAVRECEPDPVLLGDDAAELGRRRRVPLVLLVAASLES